MFFIAECMQSSGCQFNLLWGKENSQKGTNSTVGLVKSGTVKMIVTLQNEEIHLFIFVNAIDRIVIVDQKLL